MITEKCSVSIQVWTISIDTEYQNYSNILELMDNMNTERMFSWFDLLNYFIK